MGQNLKPPIDNKKVIEDLKTMDEVIHESKGRLSHNADAAGAPLPGDPVEKPGPDLRPYLSAALRVPFAVAAHRLDCKAIELQPHEADPLADQADALFNEFCPTLGASPSGKVAVFLLSLGMILVTKFFAYQKEVRPGDEDEASEAQAPASAETGFPVSQAT